MPGCCVPNCLNRADQGFRLFRLPQDESRRDVWIKLVGRANLPPQVKVCEVHFDERQFELNRADKRKLLRWDAIPTLLSKQKEIPAKRRKIDAHLPVEKIDTYVDIPQLHSGEVDIPQSNSNSDLHVNLCNLADEEIIYKLKRQLEADHHRERHLKEQLDKGNLIYNTLFTEDQSKFLETGTHRGFTWSEETFDKALKLYLACGTHGYEEICKQNLPYPSVRTLQERIQCFKSRPGILRNVFKLLECKIINFSPEEKQVTLLVDEMSIKPGIQYDQSMLACIGKPTMRLSGDKDSSDVLATHALTFMLTGITKRWKHIVAYEFTGNSFSVNEFHSKVTEIIKKATEIGLTVKTIKR